MNNPMPGSVVLVIGAAKQAFTSVKLSNCCFLHFLCDQKKHVSDEFVPFSAFQKLSFLSIQKRLKH